MDTGKEGKSLIEVYDPAKGEPPLPEHMVPMYQRFINRMTDETREARAQKALDERKSVAELYAIMHGDDDDEDDDPETDDK